MRVLALAAAGLLAACAANAPNARHAPTPLGLPSSSAAEARVRADADRAPATPGAPSPFVADPAVRSLYGGAAPEPIAPPVAPPDAPAATGSAGPAAADDGLFVPVSPAPRQREPFVPFATILGAGIGGAMSTRSHRAEGALLGAGIGLLFDLQRTVR